MAAEWRIDLLGELRVQQAERVITRFPTQKTGALLAYLAYHPQHPHPREALIELFWPEIDPEAGRASLRNALYALRQLLERDAGAAGKLLIASRTTVSLDPAAFTTDVAEFRAGLRSAGLADRPAERAARLSIALTCYRGELLPGCYDAWILQERQFLAGAYLDALHQLATALEQEGELERALEVARQAVSADPLRDEAHFDLMRAYAAAGQPSAVLRQYQELERLLQQELGEPPSAAAHALAEELRRHADEVACHRAAEAQRQPAPAAADPRAIERSSSAAPAGTERIGGPVRRAPLPSPPVPRNLPLQLTRFVGRSREIAAVRELLGTVRLLTLTGAGGCGKTRLALEVAAHAPPDAGEGVWLVELAPLSDPERVPQTIATVLEVPAQSEQELPQTLVEHLKPRHLLLLLDNCEHLLSACAQLMETLLRHCPQVRILATSREPLGLPGEQIYRVPPLTVPGIQALRRSGVPPDRSDRPDPSDPPNSSLEHLNTEHLNTERLVQFEAVTLFADRAALSQPGFTVTPANAESVVQICRQLEGMPLAIELAAARLRVMEVAQLAARLDDRFRLLTGGSRTALPRQQTLRATLDWSYDLLSPAEQALLRGLSVFAGGFTLEAAEAVCGGAGCGVKGVGCRAERPSSTLHPDVLDRLLGLVEKSLVGYEPQRGRARYRLLETVRQYAGEKVTPAERRELVRRHAAFFLALAERADRAAESEDGAERLQEVTQEYDNLRAALDGRVQSDPSRDGAAMTEEVERGLALGAALGSFWITRCYYAEGRRYLMALLARSEGSVSRARARALTVAGRLTQLQEGGSAESYRLLEAGLAMARALEEGPLVAQTLLFIVDQEPGHLNVEQRQSLCEEALARYRELGDRRGTGVALITLGLTCQMEDARRARALFEEGTGVLRQLGSSRALAWACLHLGNACQILGEYDRAAEAGRECLSLFEEYADLVGIVACHELQRRIALARGDVPDARHHARLTSEGEAEIRSQSGAGTLYTSCHRLAEVEVAGGDVAAAEALFEEALAMARAKNIDPDVVDALSGLGRVSLRRGDFGTAASRFREGLAMARAWRRPRHVLPCLEGLACALLREAEPAGASGPPATGAPLALVPRCPRLLRAAQLLGAAAAMRERVGFRRPPREQSEHDAQVVALRGSLGEARFIAVWEAGRALSWEETVASALGECA